MRCAPAETDNCLSLLHQGIFKQMAASSTRPPPRMTIESGSYCFHYLIDGDAAYLTLAEKAYPKKLAFQYLEELASEFGRLYGGQVDSVTRPYAFIKFGEARTPVWQAKTVLPPCHCSWQRSGAAPQ